EYSLRIRTASDQSGQGDRLVLRRALTAPHRLAVAPNLRVDGFAEAEALVSKLVDIFRLEAISRSVDVTDSLQQAKREESVNSGEHRNASSAPCANWVAGV